jgi:hypothetical protein
MSSDDTPRMKEISHTPPEGNSVTNVWQRGHQDQPAADDPAAADD